MPIDKINRVNLFWELTGSKGEPLVLVHGSWGDHHGWDKVTDEFAKTFRVLTYDRRGHSQSERLNEQGFMEQDVFDLIALLEYLGLSPAHIAGNSSGAIIVLKAAAKRPDLFQTLIVHEPPLFGLLSDVPEAQPILQTANSRIEAVANLIANGEHEEAAKIFVETVALGPGQWQQLPLPVRQTFIYNAPTFYDEVQDYERLQMDTAKLSHFNKPALLTNGVQRPPFYLMVLDKLMNIIPHAQRIAIEGAGHFPHMTHSEKYVEIVRNFCVGIVNEHKK